MAFNSFYLAYLLRSNNYLLSTHSHWSPCILIDLLYYYYKLFDNQSCMNLPWFSLCPSTIRFHEKKTNIIKKYIYYS